MSNFASYIASLGASAHWRLNDDASPLAADSIGSRHALWDDVPPSVDGFIDDGAKSLSDHRASTSVFSLTDNFTVTAVVGNVGQNQIGVIAQNGGSSDGWQVIVSNAGGALSPDRRVTVYVPGVTFSVFAGRALFPDTNYLVSIVRRAGTWELWINDMLEYSVAGSTPITPTGQFFIGGNNDGGGYPFQGILDELAVFPTALTSAQLIQMTKLMFLIPPSLPVVAVADNSAGGDLLTISTAATAGSFPVDGYAVWESTSSEEDSFEFDRAPLATIAPSGTFAARTAVRGKYYAIRAFDDRDEPNYGSPCVVASVAVTLDVLSEVGKIPRAATAVTAGAATTETRTVVTDSEAELVETRTIS